MRFSTRSSYGLRALVNLARNYKKRAPISLASIAREERISQAYLERLMARLKKGKLVKSTKGASGGYRLARSPRWINMKEVIEVLEGSISPFYCVGSKNICHRICTTKKVWQKLQRAISKTLSSISLNDLL